MGRLSALFAAAIPLAAATGPAAATACSAQSGPARATYIELFTSEGCNSCPPADRWLSGLVREAPPAAAPVVALAFHVDYWDYIGWRDRFASPVFTARQNARKLATGGTFMYTPQVTVDGRDARDWRRTTHPAQLRFTPPVPAGADIRLDIRGQPGRQTVSLEVDLKPESGLTPAQSVAYLAVYENGQSSAVSAGENVGRRLAHDYVVREWLGPYVFDAGGHLAARRDIARPDLDPARSGVAAVVESADGRRFLQALALPFCTGGGKGRE